MKTKRRYGKSVPSVLRRVIFWDLLALSFIFLPSSHSIFFTRPPGAVSFLPFRSPIKFNPMQPSSSTDTFTQQDQQQRGPMEQVMKMKMHSSTSSLPWPLNFIKSSSIPSSFMEDNKFPTFSMVQSLAELAKMRMEAEMENNNNNNNEYNADFGNRIPSPSSSAEIQSNPFEEMSGGGLGPGPGPGPNDMPKSFKDSMVKRPMPMKMEMGNNFHHYPKQQHQKQLNSNKKISNVLICMKGKGQRSAMLQSIARKPYRTRAERSSAVLNALHSYAKKSQEPVMEFLHKTPMAKKLHYQSFWITNQIGIRACPEELMKELSNMNQVSEILYDQKFTLDDREEQRHLNTGSNRLQAGAGGTEWNIAKIQVPEAWASGNIGEGITVANIDTGVRASHDSLRRNYKNDGHSWFDPYHATHYPYDGNGHGTHTMGTIAGGNGYGVAPGSQWIACKGLDDDGSGSTIGIIQCGQWMICPTDASGNNPDCNKTPHVVSNSWGTGNLRGFYDDVIEAWTAAGIVPVFAIGNAGPECGTTSYPGDHPAVIGVGATNSTDSIAYFSSRGPSVTGSQAPMITAPGQMVLSASHSSDYEYKSYSGTSMACPHIAGVVALMLSKRPNMSYTQVKNVLQRSTDRRLTSSGSSCHGIVDHRFPNHNFGFGRVNALKAVQNA